MYAKILVVLVLLSVSNISGQRDKNFFRNDYQYINKTQSFYKIHTLLRTWKEAKRICASEGATFFFPEDETEAKVILEHWKSSNNPKDEIFVAASDLISKGVYETIDGTSIRDVYHNWAPGEPGNNNGNEDCVVFKLDSYIHDYPCFWTFSFICKKTRASLEWNPKCNMPNTDYKFNEKLGRCYKFHRKPLSWSEAHGVCRAEQSYLAVINSQAEADYLVSLATSTPKPPVTFGNFLDGVVFLGFHDIYDSGWQPVRGATLEDTGYMKWAEGQPDGPSSGVEERCGAMSYNGLLNDVDCKNRGFFICEHDVDTLASSFDDRTGVESVD